MAGDWHSSPVLECRYKSLDKLHEDDESDIVRKDEDQTKDRSSKLLNESCGDAATYGIIEDEEFHNSPFKRKLRKLKESENKDEKKNILSEFHPTQSSEMNAKSGLIAQNEKPKSVEKVDLEKGEIDQENPEHQSEDCREESRRDSNFSETLKGSSNETSRINCLFIRNRKETKAGFFNLRTFQFKR